MVTFIPDFVSVDFATLLAEIPFEQRSVKVYGKTYPQPRLTAWYGPVEYSYSNLTWEPREFTPLVSELLAAVKAKTGTEFETVLANLYRDGTDKIGWHSDDEEIFGPDPVIASLSFGATRTFKLRRKDDTSVKRSFELTDGSLLVMPVGTQRLWEHSLPARKRVEDPRINLTFRPLR